MESTQFKNLLIKTAFSCMASDGHIDDREIQIIQSLCEKSHFFDDINYKHELHQQVQELNTKGKEFINEFLTSLENVQLSEEQEFTVIDFAIKTIQADDEIHYSEVKFFKVIKSKLHLSKQQILEKFPGIEDFLEDDIITDNHVFQLLKESFDKLGELNISMK